MLKKSSLSLRAKRSNLLLRLPRRSAPRNDTAFFSDLIEDVGCPEGNQQIQDDADYDKGLI
jgi:hypothetical protein